MGGGPSVPNSGHVGDLCLLETVAPEGLNRVNDGEWEEFEFNVGYLRGIEGIEASIDHLFRNVMDKGVKT